MKKLLVTCVVLGAVAAVTLGLQPVRADDCVIVRATADARNQTVSTEGRSGGYSTISDVS
jgi:hypothetical protein